MLIYSSLKEEDDAIEHECGTPKAKCKQLTFSFRQPKGNIIVIVVDLSFFLSYRNIN